MTLEILKMSTIINDRAILSPELTLETQFLQKLLFLFVSNAVQNNYLFNKYLLTLF